MPNSGIPLFFEGGSLRLSSPFGVSILGIGIRSRLVSTGTPPRGRGPRRGRLRRDGAPPWRRAVLHVL
eukprot:8599346-Pyramimonas_sp.AAC.1